MYTTRRRLRRRGPFESLGARGRVMRLREAAREALPHFGLPADAPLPVIGQHENTTFRLRLPRGDGGEPAQRLAVRVHRADYHSPTGLANEAAWLLALEADLPGRAVTLLRGEGGRAFALVDLGEALDAPRRVSISRWLPGRVQPRKDLAWCEAVGELTAHLHQHARQWPRPKPWERPRWDSAALCLGDAHGWAPPERLPGLTAAERDEIERLRYELAAALALWPQGPRHCGLIHADLHAHNVHIVRVPGGGSQALALDFDDCGIGWWWYDAAVSIGPSAEWPPDPAQVIAWARGYTRVAPLPPHGVARLPPLILARRLLVAGWVVGKSHEPSIRAHADTMRELLRWTVRAWHAGALHDYIGAGLHAAGARA